MTTISDEYLINESDLMRSAIVEFVENIKQNPQTTHDICLCEVTWTSLGYNTYTDLSDIMPRGLLRWG